MALSAEQLERRAGKITASMLPILMYGDAEQIQRLYREEIGELDREPQSYAMALGSHIEPFVLDYWNDCYGTLTRRGEVVDHPFIPEFCCTLDAYREFDDCALDCKFLSPWRRPEEFVGYYYPQVLAQMRCIPCRNGALLVAQGTKDPVEYTIKPDENYERAMWARVEAFRMCLRTFTPPFPMPRVVPPEQWRTIDLSKGEIPNWGHALLPLLELFETTRQASMIHEQAGKDARSLVPDDVKIVLAGTHKLSRSARGTVSIRRVAA